MYALICTTCEIAFLTTLLSSISTPPSFPVFFLRTVFVLASGDFEITCL